MAPTVEPTAIPWGIVVPWVLGAVVSTATVLSGAVTAIWLRMKSTQDQLVDAHKLRATSAENRATKAENRENEAVRRYDGLKLEFKATARALRSARRLEEEAFVGHSLSRPPDSYEDRTGAYYVESAKDRDWFEERERQRQQPLNPELDRKEREEANVDPILRRYLTPGGGTESPVPTPVPTKRRR